MDGKQPARELRFVLRKAFAECDEIVKQWEETFQHAGQIMRSLLNAIERMNDYVSAEGNLGVLSVIPNAEKNLQMKLVRSIERLLSAANTLLEAFKSLCEKVGKVLDSVVTQQQDLQESCSCEDLWSGGYHAQPSIADMLEWIYDVQVELRKELGLREHMMKRINLDAVQSCAGLIDLSQASLFFNLNRYRARSDMVKIHCM